MRINSKSSLIVALILASASLVLLSSESKAGDRFGIRAGLYTDSDDVFLGAELLSGMGSNLYLNPNIEYVFMDNASYITFNFDLHYDVISSRSAYFWLGGGIGALYLNPEPENVDSETDVGANLFAGLGFKTQGRIIPYIQGKFILSDADEFVLGFGIRF